MITHKGTVTLQTERLELRRFGTDDAQVMFENFFSDPVAVGFSRWQVHETVETTKALMAEYEWDYQISDCYNWAIAARDTNKPIGRIAVSHLDERVSTADMSFFIGRAWWHKGYASEALSAVIGFLFSAAGK